MEKDHGRVVAIRKAESPADLASVRFLLEEYWAAFGFTPGFQGFDVELATLPARYAPPRGRLLLATIDGEPAGCAALRPFDKNRGEVKRLYVRPSFRGHKIGEALMTALAREARNIGYAELIADTIPGVMVTALAMYERLGFERIAPYSDETPEAAHIRLRLQTTVDT